MLGGMKVLSQIPSIHLTNQQTILKPLFQFLPTQTNSLSHSQLESRRLNTRGFKAALSSEESSKDNAGSGDEVPRVNLKWSELLLDPDPDPDPGNVVTVGLTGALAWAGVHVLWQLFVATMATLIAGIKYTFVGVLLIFILITLL